MTQFRWRLFWTLSILMVLMLMAVLVMASRQTEATTALLTSAIRTDLDPLVETLPAAAPIAVAFADSPANPQSRIAVLVGTVKLWHSWAGKDGDALTAIVERFHQTNSNVRVETEFVEYGELARSYAEAVKNGEGPDLILAPNWWIRELAASKVLLPIGNQITAQERAQFIPATIDNLVWEGTLYGLPTDYELVALYFNRRLLNETKLPSTVDDLIQLAEESPSQGAGIYASFYHLAWGIAAYGGQLFDEDGRVVLEQTPAAADFLTRLQRADSTPGIFVSLDYGMLMDRFKREEFALFVDGPWSVGELRQRFGEDLGVTTLPAGLSGPARPWLSADGVFLNPTTPVEQRDLALTFARHMTNAESASTVARIAGRLPAHRDADLSGDPLLVGFAEQAGYAVTQPHYPELDEVWGYANDMITQVLRGTATPEEAVLEASTLINEANGK
ncbi:MAG: extracellular solute-binding protein [Caldilineaceae bacterium SB0668_bin_21]|nr:extracellular solute-binding protein [Caldilineaceae bacterium SB0668_bin_21]MYC20157.1 extracellular solute-binding protein [Caldilineaceae bacterium SB0662_bin_25]